MSSIGESHDTSPIAPISEKRRRPMVAALLALLCPGLGHLYNAAPFPALKILASMLVLQIFVPTLLLWPPTFVGLVGGMLALIIYVAFYLYSIVSAVKTARRICAARMAWFNRAWLYVLIIVIWNAAGLLAPTDRSAWASYSIPSTSMIPTLGLGDFLSASRGYYRSHRPEAGEVVVFKLPRDNRTDYVKRIVGLPGDRIQFINSRLVINGVQVARERTDDFTYDDGRGAQIGMQYIETLPNGRKYNILKFDDRGRLDETPVFVVPPRHYFVLGDNRDNSLDSRDASGAFGANGGVGYVPEENLRDRVSFIYWSSDWHRIGTPVE